MTWEGILKARNLILKGACYKVEDRFLVNPWSDSWVPTIERGVLKVLEGVNCDYVKRLVELKEEGSKH